MTEKTVIQVEGLVKHYGEVTALDGVSFSVKECEIFGLLGPNGAGKTTLMEILCCLRRFDEGNATVLAFDLIKDSRQVRGSIGFCPQETLLYELLSVRENFAFAAARANSHACRLSTDPLRGWNSSIQEMGRKRIKLKNEM